MAKINITIKNMTQIKAAFNRAPGLMVPELNKAIAKSLIKIQGRSMENTPVDTGRLRASTRTLFGNLKGEVGTHTDYDVFVHDGTRFMKGRPYLLNAVTASDGDVQSYFTEAVDNVLSAIASAA